MSGKYKLPLDESMTEQPPDILLLRFGKIGQGIQRRADLGLEIQAGHLSERQSSGIFVGRDFFVSPTDVECNVKCLADRKFTIVKDRSGGSRFLALAFGTSS